MDQEGKERKRMKGKGTQIMIKRKNIKACCLIEIYVRR
jgi:hypothetical protein